jgi:hypothetical protein
MSTASGDRDWPGGTGMVPGDGDIEEVLRRALRSAADCVEPTGDGLTRIFRRLAAPWLVRQISLLVTDCVDLLQLIAIWLQPAFAWAMSVLTDVGGSLHRACRRLTSRAAAAAAIAALAISGRRRSEHDHAVVFWHRPPALVPWARLRAAVARLRPALAVAGATVVVMMGSVAISQAVARIDPSGHPGATALAGSAPTNRGHEQSRASDISGRNLSPPAPAWPGTVPAGGGGGTHERSCAFTRCPPGPAGALPPGPAATPSVHPSSSPSPSPSPTPTPARSHHGPHQPRQSHPPHPPHPGVTQAPGR